MHRKSIPRCCAVQSLFLARTERAAQVSASVLSALKPESGHRSNRATAPRRVCLRQIRDVNERPVGRQLASNPQPNVGSLLVMAATWASFDLKMTPHPPVAAATGMPPPTLRGRRGPGHCVFLFRGGSSEQVPAPEGHRGVTSLGVPESRPLGRAAGSKQQNC